MRITTTINNFMRLLLFISIILLVFLLASCNLQNIENKNNSEPSSYLNSFTITDEDIDFCINETLDNYSPEDYTGINPIITNQLYDIDSDSQKEILILSGVIRNELFIYKKQSDEKIIEIGRFGYGKLDYVNDLKLYSYNKGNASFPFFIFHYDNGGVMSCDVIASIENINNNYDIQYKLSWGKNKYELNNEVKEINFYRLGWDKTNVAIDSSNLTLTKEEFESIYNDYKLAMQNSN